VRTLTRFSLDVSFCRDFPYIQWCVEGNVILVVRTGMVGRCVEFTRRVSEKKLTHKLAAVENGWMTWILHMTTV